MRYFFLAFALIVMMVISFFGFRGELFSSTPPASQWVFC